MTPGVPASTLDLILGIQLTVAWAGEGRCEPSRLGWWQTDLTDPEGGGDFFERLTPRTRAWSGLEAAREAALRVDAQARKQLSTPDTLRTIFFLGFDLDERISDRLLQHKRSGLPPEKALPLPLPLELPFRAEAFADALKVPEGAEYKVVPGGRHLQGSIPADPAALVRCLAMALSPFSERYPLPFYRLSA